MRECMDGLRTMRGAPQRWSRRRFLLALPIVFLVGCSSLRLNLLPSDKGDRATAEVGPRLPSKYSLRIAPYVFQSDFELKREQPIFQELAQLRDQVHKELQLPAGNTVVNVYLFEDRDHYEQFMSAKYPTLPARRAFFVAQPRSIGGPDDLLIYTFWGDRVQQDLRHELTHALLHSVLREVPLWLDEGLAEFFELPPDRQGVNAAHVENLARETKRLDLARLESLREVDQMTPTEYREAWAWVHFMLRGRPEAKTVLVTYLHHLRGTTTPAPFGPRLAAAMPDPPDALARHLANLETVVRTSASGR
jgi:hypothetical protein